MGQTPTLSQNVSNYSLGQVFHSRRDHSHTKREIRETKPNFLNLTNPAPSEGDMDLVNPVISPVPPTPRTFMQGDETKKQRDRILTKFDIIQL